MKKKREEWMKYNRTEFRRGKRKNKEKKENIIQKERKKKETKKEVLNRKESEVLKKTWSDRKREKEKLQLKNYVDLRSRNYKKNELVQSEFRKKQGGIRRNMKYVLYLGLLRTKCSLVCPEWSTNLEVFEEVVNDELIETHMGCWSKTHAYNID